MRVLLVGMMGVGKSTVGQMVADRAGWPYLDNDELVVRATGRTAKQLLAAGLAELRRAESTALTEALRMPPPLVAGIPAGVIEDPGDRERLHRGGYVVWLRATIDTLVARLGSDADRPWLQPNPRAALERLYADRAWQYAAVADLIVDVDRLSADAVADRLLAAVPKVSVP